MTEVQTSPGPYTWDDFVALGEDDRRELLDGELVEVEVPRGRHERIVSTLCFFLEGWARAHGGARVMASGYKIRIDDRRGVLPDVQLYRPDNRAPVDQDEGLERGHPDLVVEVVSPSSRRHDRITKLAWYASAGVPEYWLVDPDLATLERLVLNADGQFTIADALCERDVFRPKSFQGLEIPLAELWDF